MPEKDLINFSVFLIFFEKEIKENYGNYAQKWNNATFNTFCTSNEIDKKVRTNQKRKNNYFIFEAQKGGKSINDYTHHFFRHIRNAFAHGNVNKKIEGRKRHAYYVIKDYNYNKKPTMDGKIRVDLFWQMIDLLLK